MTPENIVELRRNTGRVLTLLCLDGRVAMAKIIAVDDEYHELVYEPIASAEDPETDIGRQIAIPIDDIATFTYTCAPATVSKRRPMSRWHGSHRPRRAAQR